MKRLAIGAALALGEWVALGWRGAWAGAGGLAQGTPLPGSHLGKRLGSRRGAAGWVTLPALGVADCWRGLARRLLIMKAAGSAFRLIAAPCCVRLTKINDLTVRHPCGLLDGALAGRSNTRPPPGGQVAQLVEQRTENPRVGGSIPPLATINFLRFNTLAEARRVLPQLSYQL